MGYSTPERPLEPSHPRAGVPGAAPRVFNIGTAVWDPPTRARACSTPRRRRGLECFTSNAPLRHAPARARACRAPRRGLFLRRNGRLGPSHPIAGVQAAAAPGFPCRNARPGPSPAGAGVPGAAPWVLNIGTPAWGPPARARAYYPEPPASPQRPTAGFGATFTGPTAAPSARRRHHSLPGLRAVRPRRPAAASTFFSFPIQIRAGRVVLVAPSAGRRGRARRHGVGPMRKEGVGPRATAPHPPLPTSSPASGRAGRHRRPRTPRQVTPGRPKATGAAGV